MPEMLVAGHARPEEWVPALELVFRHVPNRDERDTRVVNAIQLLRRGELDAQGVVVVRAGGRLRGAMVCVPAPGAGGLVWPPQAVPCAESEAIEDELMQFGSRWLRLRGAKLAQALLTAKERYLGSPLERNGFAHITSLWYLRHNLRLTASHGQPASSLTYESYSCCDRTAFHQTLLQTYEGTRDCPEVNGIRSLEEILEGHQAQGAHDPSRWWLARSAGRPVAVLLLTDIPEWQGWDVSYLGVVPEVRRRGFGRELARKAIQESRSAGAKQLTLAVDARNRAAWDLYASLGFEPYDQREVYLALWHRSAAAPTSEESLI